MKVLIKIVLFGMLVIACKSDDTCCDPPKSETTTVDNKPNILLIIADDMGIDATPGYSTGTTKPTMPNLSTLQTNGLIFDQAWAYPICSPTRATMLTGKYGYRTGVLNATDAAKIPSTEITLQAYLDAELGKTYAHAVIGKWHLSNNEPNRPIEMGIDYYAGLLGGTAAAYNGWEFTENSQTTQSTDYITTKFTDLAIDWIGSQNTPWFCWLAYTAPHTPFHLPPTTMHTKGNLPTDQASIDTNPQPYYLAMLESLDFEIGRLLATIPAKEMENTIIIFIGDNGTQGSVIQPPYVSNRSKGSVHQGGVHIPLIINGKGVTRKGERDSNMVNATDLFATIANIAGVSKNSYKDSKSFFPLLQSASVGLRTHNYTETLNSSNANKSGYAIRDSKYKLIILDSNTSRLYDLENDPFESTNLLNGTLTPEMQTAYDALVIKANEIRQ